MRKFLFVLFLLMPVSALAQDTKNTPGVLVTPSPRIDLRSSPKSEEKAKPIILDQAKLKELQIANLLLENAQLKLKAAQDAVQSAQSDVTKAGDGVAAFWKAIGINPAELSTKWQASNGVNGDIILTPAEKKPEDKKGQQ